MSNQRTVSVRLNEAEQAALIRIVAVRGQGATNSSVLKELIMQEYEGRVAPAPRVPQVWSDCTFQFRTGKVAAAKLAVTARSDRPVLAHRMVVEGLRRIEGRKGTIVSMLKDPKFKRSDVVSFQASGRFLTKLDSAAAKHGLPLRTYLGFLLAVAEAP